MEAQDRMALTFGSSIILYLRILLWLLLYMGSTLENSSPTGPGCDACTAATWALQFGSTDGIKGVGEQIQCHGCCMEFVANTTGGNHINPLSSKARPYHFQWRIIYFLMCSWSCLAMEHQGTILSIYSCKDLDSVRFPKS